MTELIRYDAACRALAEAVAVDEVKNIRDKALAMQVYAAQAKDRQLIERATEIRCRAEIRAGELLAEMEKNKGAQGSGSNQHQVRSHDATAPPTLAKLGVSKSQSSRWQRAASLSEQAREAMIERMKKSAVVVLERPTTDEKKERREAREAELAEKVLALPDKKYAVILADPEWRFGPYSRETGLDRAADNHYPTSATETIAARPVADIAAPDCVLFLWATAPMLPQALHVMQSWSFEYRSHIIWHKERLGTGYWFRNEHELLLVGTRGVVPAPAMGTQWGSLRASVRGEHSAKPDWQYELIEQYFKTSRKIELNARRPREGWDAWGLDASWSLPKQLEAAE